MRRLLRALAPQNSWDERGVGHVMKWFKASQNLRRGKREAVMGNAIGSPRKLPSQVNNDQTGGWDDRWSRNVSDPEAPGMSNDTSLRRNKRTLKGKYSGPSCS